MDISKDIAVILMTTGGIFLLGLATDALGQKTKLPRVTLMMLFGMGIGQDGLNLIPPAIVKWFPTIADMTLVMIGFLLGERFTLKNFKRYGRSVLIISASVVILTASIVFVGLLALGVPTDVALLLAGIATSTAPAATVDVIEELGFKGSFTDKLIGIVAIDDAWGLIVFSILFAFAQGVNGLGESSAIFTGLRELGGAIVIGVFLGLPMSFLTGRLKKGEPTIIEALGIVLLCGGISLWFDASFLLASMVLGGIVANLAKHHKRPFHAITEIERPFMVLFFILAGASFEIRTIPTMGLIGASYIGLRIIGRISGGLTGTIIVGKEAAQDSLIGLALLPQAGIAIGMALAASQRVPKYASSILPVVIGATIFFELIGPILTKIILLRRDAKD